MADKGLAKEFFEIMKNFFIDSNDANKLPWLILTDLLTCLLDWPKNFKDPRYLHNSLGSMALEILTDLINAYLIAGKGLTKEFERSQVSLPILSS